MRSSAIVSPHELERPLDRPLGLTPVVEAAVERAIALVMETIAELRTDAAYPA